MKTLKRSLLPLALAALAACLLSACDKDKDARPTVANDAKPESRPATVASTTPAAKANNSELITPAQTPQPPAPPALAEPMTPVVPSTPPPSPGVTTPPPVVRTPVAPAVAAQPLSNVDAWEEIKDYTYAQKTELVARVKMMTGEFDTAAAAIRSGSPKTEFADTRGDAVTALEDARTVLAQKRESLENASAETWMSAKAEFRATWKNSLAAFDKAKMMSN